MPPVLPLGVDCALSTLDLRDEERGVTLEFIKALTGVDRLSRDADGDLEEPTSLRAAERLESGVWAV